MNHQYVFKKIQKLNKIMDNPKTPFKESKNSNSNSTQNNIVNEHEDGLNLTLC